MLSVPRQLMLEPGKQALEKRDLARRARRLGMAQASDAERARLFQFADELEQEAAQLEVQTDRPGDVGL